MSQEKYIGIDVHAATVSAAVKNAEGKLLMECVLETKTATILGFIQGLRETLALTFEEGTLATWLHDLLKPHVSRLVVCDPDAHAMQCSAQDGATDQGAESDLAGMGRVLQTSPRSNPLPQTRRPDRAPHLIAPILPMAEPGLDRFTQGDAA